ncbi:MAG: hypothetical protein EBR15_07140, partial [Gammaproteobacteria bacterium]|nr:hypothetical protein [Gammaproteobacteria bacterium]
MNVSELCIRRPVFASVLSMMLVIFGLVSLDRLALREYPDIARPVVSISTVYRGASANVVENKVTQAIEDRVAGIEGIGFAIPVNLARGVIAEFTARGRVIRGWVGLAAVNLDDARVGFATIGQLHADRVGIGDDVVVGDDLPR